MKKFIAIELNIPDEYKDKEDQFIEQFLGFLTSPLENTIYRYHIIGANINHNLRMRDSVTGNYEFIDLPKGS